MFLYASIDIYSVLEPLGYTVQARFMQSFPPPPDEQCIVLQALLWATREAHGAPLWTLAEEYHSDRASFRSTLTRHERSVITDALVSYSKMFCLDESKEFSDDPHGAVELLSEVEELWLTELLQLIQTHSTCPVSIEQLGEAYHRMFSSLVDEAVVDRAIKQLHSIHIPILEIGAFLSLLASHN